MQPRKQLNNRGRAKILIADGEGVFRLGLKKLFSVEDDLRVVAQAENSVQMVAMNRSFRPDLILVQEEIALTGFDRFVDRLRSDSPNCRVLVSYSHLGDKQKEKLFRNGVSGMVSRSAQPEYFVEVVRRVLDDDHKEFSPVESGSEDVNLLNGDHQRPVDTLTPREKSIISCLTQGWRNRDIAAHLRITEQTVKNHLRSIYDKVGVSDRLELVLYAIHRRLELPPVSPFN
ncbi:MAG: response regulator transcription factor [Acidobacteria bacterium]|nr:MAG: response regulator transcription factor [Acidobacteriota bacterium]